MTNQFITGRKLVFGLFMVILMAAGITSVYALHGQFGAHDPSGIARCGDRYWIFTTGEGPYAMYSYDLVNWSAGKTPMNPGSFPSWVSGYVPGFGGTFWAPDCMYMNGKYYLYYSCSSWGSTVSCIGLITTNSLNPDSPGYAWKDEGVVVYSTSESNYNCIDPAVRRDRDGRIWLSYGSHWDGIRMVELDSVTGLVKGATTYSVAGKGDYKTEASYMYPHGDYYYLFYNRGQCCQGSGSTYYIQVGRSTSPTGPFYDKDGTDCYQGGGTTVASTSGNFIGPGCIGVYVENNTEFVTYHYYDGADHGTAKLAVGTFKWSEDGWPTVTNDWVEEGHYSILNENSQLAWDFNGSGQEQDPVVQDNYTGAPSQKWTFQAVGNGFYSILPGGKDLMAGINPCSASPGTPIGLLASGTGSCQVWQVERTADLDFIFSSKYGNRVLEVPGASTDAGTQFAINYYSGAGEQRWMLPDTFLTVSVRGDEVSPAGLLIYPNPVVSWGFTLDFGPDQPGNCMVEIFASDGRLVYSGSKNISGKTTLRLNRAPGTYFLKITTDHNVIYRKLIFKQLQF
jgi:arabinan endo-1,5-alpha-L-arabinosidase